MVLYFLWYILWHMLVLSEECRSGESYLSSIWNEEIAQA